MIQNQTHRQLQIGFSLVEMAIVLAIVALLMAGLLPTLSSQIDQQRRSETQKYMNEVRDALLGYAVANKYLPCPDTDGNGTANSPCQSNTKQQFGTLPYIDLGVASKDAYGNVLVYAVTKGFANSSTTFTLSTAGTMHVCTTNACTAYLTSTAPVAIVSRGANWANTPSSDEAENINGPSTGDTNFVSHDFTSDFDDIVVWISPNILNNRMVAAGQLP